MADWFRQPGPMTPGMRMRARTRRHSPGWRAMVAKLEADLIESFKQPAQLGILPPGPPILPDREIRRLLRLEPTGRMREHTRRALNTAGTVQSVVAAAEAAYRPRFTTMRIEPTATGIKMTPVERG